MEEKIAECESIVTDSELMEGIVCMEKISLPKFSGDPGEYTTFKSLFIRKIATARVPEVVIREYLHNSLDDENRHIAMGAQESKDIWE